MKTLRIKIQLFTLALSAAINCWGQSQPSFSQPQLTALAPNLIITEVITDKLAYSPGEQVQCKVTIRNVGSAPAVGTLQNANQGYMIDLVLSTDGVAPIVFANVPNPYHYQEDMLVIGGRHSNTNTLAPGATATFPLTFPLPSVMPKPCQLGYLALGAVADPGKKVAETNENDNTKFTRFKITCTPPTLPRPDLVISYLALANPIGGPGLPFSELKVEVRNIGGSPAIGTDTDPVNGYMVDIITSSNPNAPVVFAPLAMAGQFPEDKLVIGGRISNTKTLAPGASFVYYLKDLKLPLVDLHNYCGRNFFLGGVADPGLKIAELNEGNNTRFIEFRVDCSQYQKSN